MGYNYFEDDNVSVKSYNSIRYVVFCTDLILFLTIFRSESSVGSYDWNAADSSQQKANTLFVTVLQI